jgi:N-methylhydantoinase A
MYRVGVDIGGTFTDVVVADDAGDLVRAKALTTPADYTEGVTNAIGNAAAELGVTVEALMSDCAGFVNGTTVVTNSIAQGEGRRVGLLTTRGFKQSIYIHRGIREIQLDLQKETRPPDIVRQRHVAEIDERVNKAGEVLVELRRSRSASSGPSATRGTSGVRARSSPSSTPTSSSPCPVTSTRASASTSG